MATKTPEEFIKSLQKSGLVIVKQDQYYFIPLSVMNENLFPAEFQKNAIGISEAYFKKEPPGGNQGTALATTESLLYNKFDEVLSKFKRADGVTQAVWIDATSQVAGKDVTKAPDSKEIMFVFGDGGKKIVVDMTKGGRPSNR